jgi:hypothetical protein
VDPASLAALQIFQDEQHPAAAMGIGGWPVGRYPLAMGVCCVRVLLGMQWCRQAASSKRRQSEQRCCHLAALFKCQSLMAPQFIALHSHCLQAGRPRRGSACLAPSTSVSARRAAACCASGSAAPSSTCRWVLGSL